jgi:probable HAF family extracellular repeat protein
MLSARHRFCPLFSFAILLVLLAGGCGGGGGGGTAGVGTTTVKMDIAWAARSRAINAPSSALSASLVLTGAGPTGGDFTFTVNRDSSLAAHTGSYTSSNSAKAGTWPLTIRFYAQANGAGAVVGIAQSNVTINADGSGIGTISTTNTIASVEIPSGQGVGVGETKDLAFTARDGNGAIVAVTPGSTSFTVISGADKVQVINGQVKGLAEDGATLTASLDGKVSGPSPVTVGQSLVSGYVITDLGDLPVSTGNLHTYAVGINNNGQVTGASHNQCFLWQNGVMTDLGEGFGRGINDAGQIGVSSTSPGCFIWQNGLKTPVALYQVSGINNVGDVSGHLLIGIDTIHAAVRKNGTIIDLGTLGANSLGSNSQAFGINNNGQVVGLTSASGFTSDRAFLWQNGVMTDLGSLGTPSTAVTAVAQSINDNGQIVGVSKTPSDPNWHAVLWQNGTITDIGSMAGLSVEATQINSSGQIVGFYTNSGEGNQRALLWKNGVMIKLNDLLPAGSGWILLDAGGINDKGQIVGYGIHNGQHHGYLLTPK